MDNENVKNKIRVELDRDKKILKTFITIVKFVMLISIIVLLPLFIYFNYYSLIENFGSLDKIGAFLAAYKAQSIGIYLGMQVLQIVICILPGQALQFAGGYVFHFWSGFLYAMLGTMIGTVVTFYIARFLGKDAMFLIFGQEKLNRYIEKLNSKRAFILLFIIYLIPGIPKDLFAYAVGVSDMKFKHFFIVSILGRTPAMIGSVMMGAMFNNGSYLGVTILLVAAIILFIIGVWKYKSLHQFVDMAYVRLMKS